MAIELLVVLGIIMMMSVPFIYSKMCPSKLYEDCKVVGLKMGYVGHHDSMTIEKNGSEWAIPITRKVYHQLKKGSVIDFYYNHDEAVSRFELSAFKSRVKNEE